MAQTLFITGTDTGAGKTVLTALLIHFLRMRKASVAALKPVCSGGRHDARILHAALGGSLSLDEINPWHFRASIAPVLAARRENKSVQVADVLAFIRTTQKKFDVTLVEGAGGLLSPLGERFDSRDLVMALQAKPIVVAQNRLGAVNHILLTLEVLPKRIGTKVKIVLMSPSKPDTGTASNSKLLAEFFPAAKIWTLPWLGGNFDVATAWRRPAIRRTLAALADV
jgi:dethiobiotin synthetase